MNPLKIIIAREYLSRVTKKSFILLTIFMPFLFTALIFVPYWLSTVKDSEVRKIVVIDESGIYAPEFESTTHYQYELLSDANATEQQSRLGKDVYAILHITNDLSVNLNQLAYYLKSKPLWICSRRLNENFLRELLGKN